MCVYMFICIITTTTVFPKIYMYICMFIFLTTATTAAAAAIPIILNYFMRHLQVNKANVKSKSFSLEFSKSLMAKRHSSKIIALYQTWGFSPIHFVPVPEVRHRYPIWICKSSFCIRGTERYFDLTRSSSHSNFQDTWCFPTFWKRHLIVLESNIWNAP